MIIPFRATPDPHEGGGYVTFPTALIERHDLTDFEVRLLLFLDQAGWREGTRDGVIRLSNSEIGAPFGKSDRAIRRTIARLETLKPPFLIRGITPSKRRDYIRLVYDRYGGASVNRPALLEESITESSTQTDKNVLLSAHLVGQKCPTEMHLVGHGCPPLPIREIDEEEEEEVHLVGQKRPTRCSVPEDVAELVAWLPSVSKDSLVMANFKVMIPLWLKRVKDRRPEFAPVASDWVRDAVEKSCIKKDPVAYADSVVTGFIEAGGRAGVELPGAYRKMVAQKAKAESTTPNLPSEGSTDSLLASRRSEDAQIAARERRWKSLPDSERRSIELAFDRDNPRPSDQLPKFWSTIRLRGCQELMDRTRPQQREAR